uniref:Exosome complex component 10 homolog n=1 Tax=Glossina brevipalpis TaxID=37001 RepID=A0A1A9W6I2_9MUSC
MTSQEENNPLEDSHSTSTAVDEGASVREFTKKGFSEIMEATKCVNLFPQGIARDLYCAYPTFGSIIDEQSHRILGLISHVIKRQNVRGNIQRCQPDERFDLLLDANDTIFERLQSNLDELAGSKKNPQTVVVEARLNNITPAKATCKTAGVWKLKTNDIRQPISARLITAKNIPRPQVKFQIPVDNKAENPFMPRLKDKPNSLKPLAILPEYDESGDIVSYLHPYEFELMKFEVPNELLKAKEFPQVPRDIKETELVYVDKVEMLKDALAELCQANELAVDVEHHNYRSFLGFTCLVQISTRLKDYIFDALKLRDDMHLLNEVLTNPKIVKIFHGADLDIEWLQRDLSLYVVNMFDTHQAAKALNYARLSLAFLLKIYCDIEIDKTFQLADWRIRPLPEELIAYARQDTHFLIYVYECLTNDLLKAGNQQSQLLRNVYQRSTELCKKRYVKPVLTPSSYLDHYRKSKKIFDNRQLYALREIVQWRDAIARQEDESYNYVLPNHMMLQIAENLPREMQGILSCCNPIPPLVKQHLFNLHQILLKARQQSLVKPILEAEIVQRNVYANSVDYNSKLYCPHDLTYLDEFEHLPTLINFQSDSDQQTIPPSDGDCKACLNKANLRFYDRRKNLEEEKLIIKRKCKEKEMILEPYYRYLAMLPIAEKEKLDEAARKEAEEKKLQLCPSTTIANDDEGKTDEKTIVIQNEDDVYSKSVKEMLKRKREESSSTKTVTSVSSKSKRSKNENLKDEDLLANGHEKCMNLSIMKTKQQQTQLNNNKEVEEVLGKSVKVDKSIDENETLNSLSEELPSSSHSLRDHHHQQQQQKFNKKKNKNKIKSKKSNSSSKAYQNSNKPIQIDFDYSNADFNKFKGGAQKVKPTEFKQQFRGKNNGNKTQNKKFNKLFTFSHVKGNKK